MLRVPQAGEQCGKTLETEEQGVWVWVCIVGTEGCVSRLFFRVKGSRAAGKPDWSQITEGLKCEAEAFAFLFGTRGAIEGWICAWLCLHGGMRCAWRWFRNFVLATRRPWKMLDVGSVGDCSKSLA